MFYRKLLGQDQRLPEVPSGSAAAAAAAESLQSCPTLCDPETAASEAPPFPDSSSSRAIAFLTHGTVCANTGESPWVRAGIQRRVELPGRPRLPGPLSQPFSRPHRLWLKSRNGVSHSFHDPTWPGCLRGWVHTGGVRLPCGV